MNYNRSGFKTAILSLSLLTIMAGAAVASGTGKIAEAFPDAPKTLIKLIISFPPLFMIFAALLTGVLAQHMKSKPLIICGLVLFIIGGVGAGYTNSIAQLLLFRAILGLGTGMILSFSTGLIAACYEGAEKGKMMGYSFAANNLGAMIANILAGLLAVMSWRYMFYVYWMGLIPLILSLLFLNHLPDNRQNSSMENTRNKSMEKIPRKVFQIALYAMGIMMVFYLIVTNLALIIGERGLGTSKTSGYLFAANCLVMLCVGISLSHTMRLKKVLVPICFLLISAGLFGIFKTSALPIMVISIVLCGSGIGFLFPYLLNLGSEDIPETQSIKAMSIAMAFAWFGQFLSPLFYGAVSSLTGLDSSYMFLLTSIIFIILAVCSAAVNLFKKSAKPDSKFS